jgi:acyl-CoA reductase-like NAD-dependent aldehyde dehydrogenase
MTVSTLTHMWDGKIQKGSGSNIERMDPSTGLLLTLVPDGTAQDADKAVQSARKAFDEGPWRFISGMERAKYINTLAQLLDANQKSFAEIEAKETGKTLALALGDVTNSANLFRYAASLAMTMHGDVHTNLGKGFTGLVTRVPVGVATLITPWNFPLLLMAQKLPFAIGAGCTVVLKPSEYTSSTSSMFAELVKEAKIPDGVINVVLGYGHTVGQRLIEHPDVDFVSFTGSTRTGRTVIDASKHTLKRTSMELGGKSANIVFEDANIDDAIDGVMFGVLFNNGECCVSGSRLLVQDSIADEFVKNLSIRMGKLKIGDPLKPGVDIGPMIHGGHLDAVLDHVAKAVSQGAKVTIGGTKLKAEGLSKGFFVGPTIVDHVTEKQDIFHDEVFGPVLTVTRFKDASDAIKIANSVKYGLANSVWSKNIDTALDMAGELRSGTVWINTTIDGSPQLPGGGVKESGFGREMGQVGFDEFTEIKTIQIRTGARNHFFK